MHITRGQLEKRERELYATYQKTKSSVTYGRWLEISDILKKLGKDTRIGDKR